MLDQLIGPWGIWMQLKKINIQAYFTDLYLKGFW